MLRKVKSVSTINNEIKVETEFASITDCMKQGVIDINQPLTIKQIKRIDYHYDGIKLMNNLKSGGNEPVNLSINSVIYDLDGNKATITDQIKLIGTLTCDWGFNLKIDVGLLQGLKEVKFGVTGSENLDLQLVAGIQYSFKKEISLATVHFTPILTTVGIWPILVTPQLEILIGIDGSANASITSKITQSLSFDNGIRFLKDQGWSPYKTFDKNFSFQPPQLNMNASACAYLMPEFFIKLDLIAGPYANLKIYSRLDADLLQTPWWKFYGGVTMNAGAKVDIIDKFTLDYTVSDLINIELLLAQSTTPPIQSPTITTNTITNITQNTASSGGNVTSDGGATVTARGVCWSTTQNPTTSNFKTTDGSGINTFTSNLTALTANTTYYVRAYATNSVNTAYGNQVTFTTSSGGVTGTVTDIDGNVYHTVQIGTQVWMVENLKTTKYRNGDPIPNVTGDAAWSTLNTGAYSWYNNDAATNKAIYGALYNWYAATDSRNIAPTGWHVPTDSEWTTLTTYLGGESVADGKLKEIGTTHWQSPNTGATNSSGFTALPGGNRNEGGTFNTVGSLGYWWSSTNNGGCGSWYRRIYNTAPLGMRDCWYTRAGFSIRCLKD